MQFVHWRPQELLSYVRQIILPSERRAQSIEFQPLLHIKHCLSDSAAFQKSTPSQIIIIITILCNSLLFSTLIEQDMRVTVAVISYRPNTHHVAGECFRHNIRTTRMYQVSINIPLNRPTLRLIGTRRYSAKHWSQSSEQLFITNGALSFEFYEWVCVLATTPVQYVISPEFSGEFEN